MTVRVLLGLGSNLGDRIKAIHQGVALLGAHPSVEVVEVSRLYETEPIDMATGESGEEAPWFINGAVCIDTDLSAEALLDVCLSIERQMGRERLEGSAVRYGALSRQLDIDILFYDSRVISTSVITIPHPRLHERAFVLAPLRDIAPDWLHPLLDKTILELYFDLPDPGKVIPTTPGYPHIGH